MRIMVETNNFAGANYLLGLGVSPFEEIGEPSAFEYAVDAEKETFVNLFIEAACENKSIVVDEVLFPYFCKNVEDANFEIVSKILPICPHYASDLKASDGKTAFEKALQNNCLEIAQFFIDEGVNFRKKKNLELLIDLFDRNDGNLQIQMGVINFLLNNDVNLRNGGFVEKMISASRLEYVKVLKENKISLSKEEKEKIALLNSLLQGFAFKNLFYLEGYDLAIGKYEISQKIYEEIMGENPSKHHGENLPVENVTVADAKKFCELLTLRERKNGNLSACCEYTLPNVSEWKLFVDHLVVDEKMPKKQFAWSEENSGLKTHPVDSKGKNGVFNFYGNVWEWCDNELNYEDHLLPTENYLINNQILSKDVAHEIVESLNKSMTQEEIYVAMGGSAFSYAMFCDSNVVIGFSNHEKEQPIGFRIVLRRSKKQN